jgi:excisionase family DNA binding protein
LTVLENRLQYIALKKNEIAFDIMPCKKVLLMQNDTTFLTVKEIAAYLNLKELAVYRLLKDGRLEHFKFGRQIRVKKEDFERFLQRSKVSQPTGRD